MPKERELQRSIPNLYKRKTEDAILYGMYIGLRDTHTREAIILRFMEAFNLNDDNFNLQYGQNVITRMNQEARDVK